MAGLIDRRKDSVLRWLLVSFAALCLVAGGTRTAAAVPPTVPGIPFMEITDGGGTEGSVTHVRLSWASVPDFNGTYVVERALLPTAKAERHFGIVGRIESSSAVSGRLVYREDVDWATMSKYVPAYRVRAEVDGVLGTPSGENYAILPPGAVPAPSPPTDLRADVSANALNADGSFIPPEQRTWGVAVTWTSPPGFEGYFSVYRRTSDPGAVPELVATIQAPTAGSDHVEYQQPIQWPLPEMCYQVSATAQYGAGFRAEACTVVRPRTGPGAPTSPTPTAPDAGNSFPAERERDELPLALCAAIAAAAAALAAAHRLRRKAQGDNEYA